MIPRGHFYGGKVTGVFLESNKELLLCCTFVIWREVWEDRKVFEKGGVDWEFHFIN